MSPQILFRAFSDSPFYPLIDAQAIGFIAIAREILQRRMNDQAITAAVGQTLLGKGHDLRPAKLRKLAGRGNSRRLNAKQRHKHALFGAVILIRRIPDSATSAQQLEHAAHVFALDCQ